MQKQAKLFNLLVLIDIVVLIVCGLLINAVSNFSGDTATALYFVLMLLFMFVALPLLFTIFVLALMIRPINLNGIFYIILSTFLHLWLAHSMGFFEKAIDAWQAQKKVEGNLPLHQLRTEMNRLTSRNLAKIVDALNKGANPDASLGDEYVLPVLLLATSNNDTQVMQALLNAGADPNQRAIVKVLGIPNPSALDVVLFGEGKDKAAIASADILLAASAEPRNSLLALGACYRGSIEFYIKAEILEANTLQDSHGNGCLHHAVKNNRIAFIKKMFQSANIYPNIISQLNQNNNAQVKPLDIAVGQRFTALATFLISVGAISDYPTTMKRYHQQTKTLKAVSAY